MKWKRRVFKVLGFLPELLLIVFGSFFFLFLCFGVRLERVQSTLSIEISVEREDCLLFKAKLVFGWLFSFFLSYCFGMNEGT